MCNRSHAVGDGIRCIDVDKMCNVTHFLLVIDNDMKGLSFTNVQYHSQTRKRYDETGFHKICNPSLADWKRCDETALHKICNVTHKLIVIGKNVMRLPFRINNPTHSLLVIGKDV